MMKLYTALVPHFLIDFQKLYSNNQKKPNSTGTQSIPLHVNRPSNLLAAENISI